MHRYMYVTQFDDVSNFNKIVNKEKQITQNWAMFNEQDIPDYQ